MRCWTSSVAERSDLQRKGCRYRLQLTRHRMTQLDICRNGTREPKAKRPRAHLLVARNGIYFLLGFWYEELLVSFGHILPVEMELWRIRQELSEDCWLVGGFRFIARLLAYPSCYRLPPFAPAQALPTPRPKWPAIKTLATPRWRPLLEKRRILVHDGHPSMHPGAWEHWQAVYLPIKFRPSSLSRCLRLWHGPLAAVHNLVELQWPKVLPSGPCWQGMYTRANSESIDPLDSFEGQSLPAGPYGIDLSRRQPNFVGLHNNRVSERPCHHPKVRLGSTEDGRADCRAIPPPWWFSRRSRPERPPHIPK